VEQSLKEASMAGDNFISSYHIVGRQIASQTEIIRDVLLSAAECSPDGGWMTLRELADLTAYRETAISAQLRRLRAPKYGSFVIDKRRRSASFDWEYRIAGRCVPVTIRLQVI
jgi:hypothetical protein